MKRFLFVALLLATAAWAQAKERPKAQAAAGKNAAGVEVRNAGAVVPSAVVEKRVDKLNDKLAWFTSLDEAKSAAARQKKPIFWVHLLGDIDGEC